MDQIERQMALGSDAPDSIPHGGQLLALVDALSAGTLNETQRETVQALRAGILAIAEREAGTASAAEEGDAAAESV